MVPQVFTGLVIAQPGLGRQFVTTASDQQSLGKPLVQLPSSHVEARHTRLPFVTPAMPPQTVVSRMNDLKISGGTSQLLQKPVYAEKRDQSAQTVEGRGLLTCDSHSLPAAASVSGHAKCSYVFGLIRLFDKVRAELVRDISRSL